ncbi:MAG: hypothetical protein JRI52_07545 [Deltaproteobacteria bacterium]|nr:hypothetical protein [Deltaproteobacteria bacterium]
MFQELDLKEIGKRIHLMKKNVEELNEMVNRFPALEKNTSRILASINMLEINLTDLLDL